MIKLHEILLQGSEDYAKSILGAQGLEQERDTAIEIMKDFQAGAEFIIDNIIRLKDQYPLMGLISIQTDPNDTTIRKVSANMSGITQEELVTLLKDWSNSLLKGIGKGTTLVEMTTADALRREAFQETLNAIKAERELRPD